MVTEKVKRHTPGDCHCGLYHHCCHVNQNIEDIGAEEICCHCGMTMPILRTPVEDHGPWVWWIYKNKTVSPEHDICPGSRVPPERYVERMKALSGIKTPHFDGV